MVKKGTRDKEDCTFIQPSDSPLPLGIIADELLTKAMKRAFPGREPGCLTITADSADGLNRVCVSDDGAARRGLSSPRN